jgi:hypothetical protein
MGKKHPAHRPWTVQLTALYRPDRDARIAKAYELALPIRVSSLKPTPQEEDPRNDVVPTYRHLRPRVQ